MKMARLHDIPETIPKALTAMASHAPDRMAMQVKVGEAYRTYTYRELAQRVQGLAAGLVHHGLQAGERVAIVLENRPEWAMAYLSILAAGGTAVPLDIQLTQQELRTLLFESGSQKIFVSAKTWPLLKDNFSKLFIIMLDAQPDVPGWRWDELVAQGEQHGFSEARVHPDDVASLLYTSGTTGKPKGVLLTHRNCLSNAKSIMSFGLASAEDNFLVMLPLHHTYPFMIAFLVPLLLGARMTFLRTFKGPELMQCLQETQVTIFVGVPQIFAMVRRAIFDQASRQPPLLRLIFFALLAVAGFAHRLTGLSLGRFLFHSLHKRFGGSLRLLCNGGAKLDQQVAHDLDRLGFTIRDGYGLTETSPVVSFNPMGQPKPGSVGLPIPGVEVRIHEPDAGGVGEVVVRGLNVMKGYDRNPEATADAVRDGWFHTGDLGYLDVDGYLFLTGRSKELIVTAGGKNIYPEELEAEYLKSPAIAELCLIGLERTGEGGEGLHAVVVPNFEHLKGQRIPDIRQHLKDELTRIGLGLPLYKRIGGLTVVKESLPRTRLGKLQRHKVAVLLKANRETSKALPRLSPEDQILVETETAQSVLATLAAWLSVPQPPRLDDHLDLDLGLDSLRRVEMVVALERQFGPLPETLAMEVTTVRDVIEQVSAQVHGAAGDRTGPPQSWHDLIEMDPPPKMREAMEFPPSFVHRFVAAGTRMALWLILKMVFRLSIKGMERLPRQGPFLLAPNHVSHVDPFVVMVSVSPGLFDRLYTLGWEGYFRGPVMAWVARVGHVIPLGIDTSYATALQISAAVLRRDKSLLIFPEGERSINGRLLPFRKGIGILACELRVPVVPVLIEGTFQVLPVGAAWPRRHPISLEFGEPFTITSDLSERWKQEGMDPYDAAAGLAQEHVRRLANKAADEQ